MVARVCLIPSFALSQRGLALAYNSGAWWSLGLFLHSSICFVVLSMYVASRTCKILGGPEMRRALLFALSFGGFKTLLPLTSAAPPP